MEISPPTIMGQNPRCCRLCFRLRRTPTVIFLRPPSASKDRDSRSTQVFNGPAVTWLRRRRLILALEMHSPSFNRFFFCLIIFLLFSIVSLGALVIHDFIIATNVRKNRAIVVTLVRALLPHSCKALGLYTVWPYHSLTA